MGKCIVDAMATPTHPQKENAVNMTASATNVAMINVIPFKAMS